MSGPPPSLRQVTPLSTAVSASVTLLSRVPCTVAIPASSQHPHIQALAGYGMVYPRRAFGERAPREPPSSVGLYLLVFTCTGIQGHSPWLCVLLDQNREYIILSHCPGDYLTKGVIPVGFKTVSLAMACFSSERENKSLSSTRLPQKALCKA